MKITINFKPMYTLEELKWTSVKHFEDIYEISENGDLRSIDRVIINKRQIAHNLKGKLQKKSINKYGYVYYDLYKNCIKNRFLAHRLVISNFKQIEHNKDVNHIDGNKLNNSVKNLEYLSRSENMIHAFKIGLCKKTLENCKKGNNSIKKGVLNLETGIFYNSISEASVAHNLNTSTLTQSLRGKLQNKTSLILY